MQQARKTRRANTGLCHHRDWNIPSTYYLQAATQNITTLPWPFHSSKFHQKTSALSKAGPRLSTCILHCHIGSRISNSVFQRRCMIQQTYLLSFVRSTDNYLKLILLLQRRFRNCALSLHSVSAADHHDSVMKLIMIFGHEKGDADQIPAPLPD